MIEEEFDLKHLDITTRHLDKHLGGFPKRVRDEGSIEYIFEDQYFAFASKESQTSDSG